MGGEIFYLTDPSKICKGNLIWTLRASSNGRISDCTVCIWLQNSTKTYNFSKQFIYLCTVRVFLASEGKQKPIQFCILQVNIAKKGETATSHHVSFGKSRSRIDHFEIHWSQNWKKKLGKGKFVLKPEKWKVKKDKLRQI